MNANIGSGSEDLSGDILRQDAARLENNRNRAAEDAARNWRLDRDALIAAALDRFEGSALEAGEGLHTFGVWSSFYILLATGRSIKPADVASLIAEIRAQLSPLVRG